MPISTTRARLDPTLGKIIIPVKRHIVFLARIKSLLLIILCAFFISFPVYMLVIGNSQITDANIFFLTIISFALCAFLFLAAKRVIKYRGKSSHEIKLSPHELKTFNFYNDLLVSGAYVVNIGQNKQLFGVTNLQAFLEGQRIARTEGYPVAR